MLSLLLLSLAQAAPLAACERVYTTPDLTDALDSADGNFRKQDAEGFKFSASAVSTRLACMGEPLVPDVLARVYLVEALRAFLAKDDPRLAAALAAMASSNPGYQIPLALVPDGHPLRAAMKPASLLLRDPITTPLAAPDVGWIEVDGAHRAEAPTNRDVILQRYGGDGQITETMYVRAGESLAGWAGPTPSQKPATTPRIVATATPLPLAAHRAFAVRGSLDVVGGGLGTPETTLENPPGFGGPGARIGVGVELGAGRFGGFAEVAWLGVFAPEAGSGANGSANGAVASIGPQLRIGTFTIEAGPAWSLSAVHLEGVDCGGDGCGGEATTGVGSAEGVVMAGGGVIGVDARLGGPDSMLAVAVGGGAVTDLTRASYWGGVGLRFGKRWSGT